MLSRLVTPYNFDIGFSLEKREEEVLLKEAVHHI